MEGSDDGLSSRSYNFNNMCKAIDKGMIIGEIKLEEKLGGKSGVWKREENNKINYLNFSLPN